VGSEGTILFADNDPQTSTVLCNAIARAGYTVEHCPLESLSSISDETPQGIVVLNLGSDVAAGLEYQQQLNNAGYVWPIIFIADCEQVPVAVKAIKGGAIDFHIAPVPPEDLLRSIQEAALRLKNESDESLHRISVEQRCACLTSRELEIMKYITNGVTNLEIARRLGLSQRTIEVHRAHVMEKMQAISLADLTRMVDVCGLCNEEDE
jgi:two-component system, LuxR family, response regulator FixJ